MTERKPKLPFQDRWLRARLILATYRDRTAKALALLDSIEARTPLDLPHRALRAYLKMRAGETDTAFALFRDVRAAAKAGADAESRYIRHYAAAWLASIRTDPFNAREQHRAAANIACSPRLKRLLWLPTGGEPDRIEEEFDAWMKDNPPAEGDLRKRRIDQSRQ